MILQYQTNMSIIKQYCITLIANPYCTDYRSCLGVISRNFLIRVILWGRESWGSRCVFVVCVLCCLLCCILLCYTLRVACSALWFYCMCSPFDLGRPGIILFLRAERIAADGSSRHSMHKDRSHSEMAPCIGGMAPNAKLQLHGAYVHAWTCLDI